MKRATKTSLIIIMLALLACIIVLMLRSRSDEPADLVGASVANPSLGPVFDVRVIMPRAGLPLAGILPDWVVRKMDGTPREMRFDQASSGARVGNVGNDRLALTADGWDLSIEADSEGRITSGTRLVFDLSIGGRHVKLRCRPANSTIGQLHTSTRAGSTELGGSFIVELAVCENVASGKYSQWPPAPITLRGSFANLPPSRSSSPTEVR
ncbi:MAG TPA: hypothetical protein VN643_16035 [Pyrinomonadaceae bacterium]|nr:hypothetical protein [Pyrinomonadaceae bacterium]